MYRCQYETTQRLLQEIGQHWPQINKTLMFDIPLLRITVRLISDDMAIKICGNRTRVSQYSVSSFPSYDSTNVLSDMKFGVEICSSSSSSSQRNCSNLYWTSILRIRIRILVGKRALTHSHINRSLLLLIILISIGCEIFEFSNISAWCASQTRDSNSFLLLSYIHKTCILCAL